MSMLEHFSFCLAIGSGVCAAMCFYALFSAGLSGIKRFGLIVGIIVFTAGEIALHISIT